MQSIRIERAEECRAVEVSLAAVHGERKALVVANLACMAVMAVVGAVFDDDVVKLGQALAVNVCEVLRAVAADEAEALALHRAYCTMIDLLIV